MSWQITQGDGQLNVIGELSFSNVESCLMELCKTVQAYKSAQIKINFAQVKHKDGSIITLMTSLLRRVNALGIKVTYISVPDHILRISELYGVKNILPIAV